MGSMDQLSRFQMYFFSLCDLEVKYLQAVLQQWIIPFSFRVKQKMSGAEIPPAAALYSDVADIVKQQGEQSHGLSTIFKKAVSRRLF